MAQTGGFWPITPGPRTAGFPTCFDVPEASSQTYNLGAPVYKSAGYLKTIAVSGTAVYGFAAQGGGNGATDGAVSGKVYVARPQELFEITLSVASWDQSLVGSNVGLSSFTSAIGGGTSTIWAAVTATAVSASAQIQIQKLAPGPGGIPWAAGDNKPRVYVTVLNANAQGEV